MYTYLKSHGIINSNNIPRLSSSSNTQEFQSLEELLNDAGVITVDTDTSSQGTTYCMYMYKWLYRDGLFM